MSKEMGKLIKWAMKTARSDKAGVFSYYHPLGCGAAIAHVSAFSLQTPRAGITSCSLLMKPPISW